MYNAAVSAASFYCSGYFIESYSERSIKLGIYLLKSDQNLLILWDFAGLYVVNAEFTEEIAYYTLAKKDC